MSETTIQSILDAYYFRQASRLNVTDSFLDIDELTKHMCDIFENLPGISISDPVERTDIGAKRFLGYLLDADCFHRKEIPFSRPVFRYNQARFENVRNAFLKASDVYNQSMDYPGYFPRSFEGYLNHRELAKAGEVGDTIAFDLIASQDWTEVEASMQGEALRDVRSKTVELASSIQQAEIDENLKARLLGRVRAVHALLEVDQPEWPEIVRLLNFPHLTAFLNAYAILSIILGLSS